jgi:glutathione S-transferase
MASASIQLQPAHGFLPLLVILVVFVSLWAGMKVGKARKLYDVPYPQVRRAIQLEFLWGYWLTWRCRR